LDLCDQGIIPSITGRKNNAKDFSNQIQNLFLSPGYLRRMAQQKAIHMDYVDLDIICDGLFILSCLCELDVHRKVRQFRMINKEGFDFS
jgi:hypothetical protein